MVDITHLYFGKASAEKDVLSNPERFLETYLDRWDLPQQVLDHEKFLILGPKGSGKSAAAHYVALRWKKRFGEHSVFSNFVDFDELNRTQTPLYSLDKKLVSDEVSALTDAAWKLFISIRMLDSLIVDQACNLAHDPRATKLVAELKRVGLASDDYPQVLRKVRERKGSISIPKFASTELKSTDTETISLSQLGDAIMGLVSGAQTPNRHLLSIDGLDKAIGENDSYWRTLAALIRTADSVCEDLLRAHNESVFLLIMCRSDVFRRIRFADAPKIAADGGVHMEWGAEAHDVREVVLWDYIARKARVDTDELVAALPRVVSVGQDNRIPTLRYILEFTRYTPRDMNLIFNAMKGRAYVDQPLSGAQVRAGADSFASSHLLHEILSEATGLLPQAVIDALPQILSSLTSRIFDRDSLAKAIRDMGVESQTSLDGLAEYLFLQGAIGNYRPSVRYVQFYHRRNTYDYNRSGPWMLHTGLTYALNVPFSEGTSKANSSRS
jgi:hypothetical protein